MEQSDIKCTNCGFNNALVAKFCTNCGAKLVQHPLQNPVAQPPAMVQCPNCGGYKVKDITPRARTGGETLLLIVAGFFTGGLAWLLFLFDIFDNKKNIPQDGSLNYLCELCGYRWSWKPGTPLPQVVVQPDLISKGAQKLEEDEKRRRDAEYWEEQQKKRNEKK